MTCTCPAPCDTCPPLTDDTRNVARARVPSPEVMAEKYLAVRDQILASPPPPPPARPASGGVR